MEYTSSRPTSGFSGGRRSFLHRFSNASIRTLLPQYSVEDNEPESIPSFGRQSWAGSSASSHQPPRYSLLHPAKVIMTVGERTSMFSVDGGYEFQYMFPIKPKKPWATLFLHTRDAVPGNLTPSKSQPKIPRIWSCEPISGRLELELDSAQTIQQIIIQINGSVVVSSHSDGTLPFLAHEFLLWDKSKGNPLEANEATNKKFDGRFDSGLYNFPFSFPLPTDVDPTTKYGIFENSSRPPPFSSEKTRKPEHVGSAEKQKAMLSDSRSTSLTTLPSVIKGSETRTSAAASTSRPSLASHLPQSFTEKGVNPDVKYDIAVRIVHGRFKTISKIKSNIVYVPASRPLPLSQKRRKSYEEGALLPNPMVDPEGWLEWPTLPLANFNGRLRSARAHCTLYIAQPLSYTRGSVIPCFLAIFSDDNEEVVQLLARLESPVVRLVRRIRHPIGMADESSPQYSFGMGDTPVNNSWSHILVGDGETKRVSHEVGRARWWPSSKGDVQTTSSHVRNLEGEIHLSPSLQPSCDSPSFEVEYDVELLPFETDDFEPPPSVRKQDEVLASKPVEIVTLYREEDPIPTAYTEPPKVYTIRRVKSNSGQDKLFENE